MARLNSQTRERRYAEESIDSGLRQAFCFVPHDCGHPLVMKFMRDTRLRRLHGRGSWLGPGWAVKPVLMVQ